MSHIDIRVIATSFVILFLVCAYLNWMVSRLWNKLDRLDKKLAEHLSVDPRYTRQEP